MTPKADFRKRKVNTEKNTQFKNELQLKPAYKNLVI